MQDVTPIAGRAVTLNARPSVARGRRLLALADRAATRGRDGGGRAARDPRPTPRGARRGLTLTRALPFLIGFGMLLAGLVLVTQRRERTWTVSEVTREMRRLALEGGEAATPMAGTLGPLRIAARTIDATTGEFLDFRIDSDRLLVTARRAVLTVDPDADTFAFDLHDVVFTRVPPEGGTQDGSAAEMSALAVGGSGGGDGASFIHTTERHLFGPAAFGQDIVPDDGSRTSGRGIAGRRSGGVLSPRGANAGESSNTDWLRDAGAD